MALNALSTKYLSRSNDFFRLHYHQFFYVLTIVIFVMIILVFVAYEEVIHRPPPSFIGITQKGARMNLPSFNEPNLLPDTIIRWAKKAATTAYTFDYANYRDQLKLARPFFTDDGWSSFQRSVSNTISTIVKNQLFINSVVKGTPVISRQGSLPGVPMAWRVEIPFLVAYISANTSIQSSFIVVLTITPVPTSINPAGIGISQFVMVG